MADPTPRKIASYGWHPDLPDSRDHLYAAPRIAVVALPQSVDLRQQCPPVYDQGRIGSCTANAIAGAFEFELGKQQLADFMPSRLFIYYNERVMEHNVASDAGAMIRDGMKSVNKQGVCPEEQWPYDDTPADSEGRFPVGSRAAQRPSSECYAAALRHRASTYQRVVRELDQMRGCLASGYPFVFGFTVYSGFETQAVAQTGRVEMPTPDEDVVGGHAVLAVGYDDAAQRFLVRNSWGTGWGDAGYFTMPYAYLTERSLSADFWTIRIVT
jgi:C1A family cysteine protease